VEAEQICSRLSPSKDNQLFNFYMRTGCDKVPKRRLKMNSLRTKDGKNSASHDNHSHYARRDLVL
jgi:hypothetical protein